MSEKRYHVEVKVRESNEYVWRPIRPKGGETYTFTWSDANRYIEVYGISHPGSYRMVEIKQ